MGIFSFLKEQWQEAGNVAEQSRVTFLGVESRVDWDAGLNGGLGTGFSLPFPPGGSLSL